MKFSVTITKTAVLKGTAVCPTVGQFCTCSDLSCVFSFPEWLLNLLNSKYIFLVLILFDELVAHTNRPWGRGTREQITVTRVCRHHDKIHQFIYLPEKLKHQNQTLKPNCLVQILAPTSFCSVLWTMFTLFCTSSRSLFAECWKHASISSSYLDPLITFLETGLFTAPYSPPWLSSISKRLIQCVFLL